jgi:hypothetical protein
LFEHGHEECGGGTKLVMNFYFSSFSAEECLGAKLLAALLLCMLLSMQSDIVDAVPTCS